jgi:hypothetical protein
MTKDPFSAPNRMPSPPSQAQPGEQVWRLKSESGRIYTCELRNDPRVGAGWDVVLLKDGETLLSQQYDSDAEARFAAEICRKDLLRTGWSLL